MEQETAVTLLKAMTLLQGVVLSGIDRKRFTFTRSQLSIFTILAMEGELTMKRVAGYIVSSKEQATRAVAPLADAGYVERRTDPENRTRVYIRLTEKGRHMVEEVQSVLTENLSRKISDSLNEEEKAEVYRAGACLVDLLERIK